MQQEFLNMTPATWNIIFLIVRYVAVALLLAYLANVYAKRKNIQTDIKGRVLEWRVDTYKSIHRWVMKFKSIVAAPSQYEEHYRSILSFSKFKIGYQGMEYSSFFDTPERLLQFGIEFNRMLDKEEEFIDYQLRHELDGFQMWLDDVIMFYGAFVRSEYDNRWGMDEKTIKEHCELASKVMGIALQGDVNRFYNRIDDMLRGRLQNIKISGVYSESWWSRRKRKATEYCERMMNKEKKGRYSRMVEWFYYHILFRDYGSSQLLKNQFGLMTIFMLVHFEEQFANNPGLMRDKAEFIRLTKEFHDCYSQHIEK